MVDALVALGLPRRTVSTTASKPAGRPFHTVKFSGETQCRTLFQALYENVPESQYLKRKHDSLLSAVPLEA